MCSLANHYKLSWIFITLTLSTLAKVNKKRLEIRKLACLILAKQEGKKYLYSYIVNGANSNTTPMPTPKYMLKKRTKSISEEDVNTMTWVISFCIGEFWGVDSEAKLHRGYRYLMVFKLRVWVCYDKILRVCPIARRD